MRPLKLSLRGFGSFRSDTAVDFSDVEQAALVGPTGSGKTTIIDGITFALFGTVARYDDARAVAPVINQLAAEARVSLDFEAGGEAYTATRVVRRTAAGASTREARLERGEQTLAGSAREMGPAVEGLLGLDFDRFTKTVVLPQGRFAEFLHDKAADRQELLKHLIGLGIYDRVGAEARRRAATARDQIAALRPELEREAPTAERVTELAGLAEAARAAQAELEARMEQLEVAVADRKAAEGEMSRLAAAGKVLARSKAVPGAVQRLDAELQAAREASDGAAAKYEEARDAATGARREADEGPSVGQCRRLLDDHGRLDAERGRLDSLQERAGEAERVAGEAVAAAEVVRERLAEAEGAAAAARRAAEQALDSAAGGPDRGQIERVRALRAELEELAPQVADRAVEHERAVAAEQSAQAEQSAAKGVLSKAVERLDLARALKQAEGLVTQLREGEPCPVCRRTVVELPEHDPDAELARLDVDHRRAQSEVERAADALVELRSASARLSSQLQQLSAREKTLQHELQGQPDGVELDRLESQADELAAEAERCSAARQAAEQAERDLRDAAETRDCLRAEQDAEVEKAKVEADRDSCQRQCQELEERLAGEPEVAQLEADIERAGALAAARQKAEAAEQTAHERKQQAVKALEALEADEQRARRDYGARRDELAPLSPPAPEASLLQDWEDLAAWAIETLAAVARQSEAAERRARDAQGRERELIASARTLCSAHFEPGDDSSRFVSEMAVAVTNAEMSHKTATEELRRRQQLEARVGKLRADEEVAAELGRLLRADGFERWLLVGAVGDLIERANERLLELSDGKYSFVPDDPDFGICDHQNADEVRGAKTLSGGETFLASLALALALGDGGGETASAGSPALGSLFLDEGFGTLDPDALGVVAGAIGDLAESGRMVCIVTHISELGDEMPVRFVVSKGPDTSMIERVEA